MVCDLCNSNVTSSTSKAVTAMAMRSAALRGFNAMTTPGFDHSAAAAVEMLGIDVQVVADEWRTKALTDSTDWLLCDKCYHTFDAQFGGA